MLDETLKRLVPLRRHVFDAQVVRPGKHELRGIDNALAYKSPGLARAAARVAGVHQAAVVLHEGTQLLPRTGQALAKVVFAHVEHLAARGVADLEHLTQYKYQALRAVQAQQHAHHATELGLFHQQMPLGRGTIFGAQVFVRRVGQIPGVAVKTLHSELGAAALAVKQEVEGYAVDPGAEGAVTSKRGQMRDDLQQAFLRGLFGILWLLEHA